MVIGYDWIEKVLTDQAIKEEVIDHNEVVSIMSIEVDNDARQLVFMCEVYHHVYN